MINIKNEALLKAFGQRVKQLREERRMTQEKLANEAGIEPKQLRRIEGGQVNTTLSSIYILAKALDIEMSEIIDPLKIQDYQV